MKTSIRTIEILGFVILPVHGASLLHHRMLDGNANDLAGSSSLPATSFSMTAWFSPADLSGCITIVGARNAGNVGGSLSHQITQRRPSSESKSSLLVGAPKSLTCRLKSAGWNQSFP
jgi:hypothetical protein